MVVSFGILFHANSPFSWSFEPAYHAAYQPAVDILEEYDIHINWHLAGPLLQMLNWKYPKLIDQIIKGIENGRYEILSSSYAQNVLYATSEWANKHHLEKNKEIIQDIFAIESFGFWNPERVWSDKFAPWLIEYEYQYTLVENKALQPENPEVANKVFFKEIDGKTLYLLPDNQEILKKIDHALWTGEFDQFIDYLKYLDEKYDNPVVCYAQDAENLGYWQQAHPDVDTEDVYNNLRKLLDTLIDLEWVTISKFSDIIANNPHYSIGSLPDGQATWMEESAKTDGYSDYFDYLRTSPEIKYYQDLYDKIENELQKDKYTKYEHSLLYQEALGVFLSHQFEFGCATGSLGNDKTRYLLNVPGKMILEGTRLSRFMLKVFDNPKYQLKWEYWGNHPVIIFSNEDLYSVWSPFGGRCIMLVDRDKHTMISPNPYFYNMGNSVADLELPSPTFEFPEIGSSIIHGGTLLADTLEINGQQTGMQAVVKRVFSNHGIHDELGPSLPHNYFDCQIVPFDNMIKFWIRLGPYLLMKEITLLSKEIRVNYTLTSDSEHKDLVKLGISNEVSPSPNDIMIGGTNILDINLGTTDYSITNIATGAGLDIQSSVIPSSTEVIEAIFAKRIGLFFSHRLYKDNPLVLNFKLSLL